MEIATLQAERRQAGGTRAAQRLRRTGKLPGVIYGHHEDPETVAVNAHDLNVLLEHGAHVVQLDVDGSKTQVLIKDVQLDHLGASLVHVDFGASGAMDGSGTFPLNTLAEALLSLTSGGTIRLLDDSGIRATSETGSFTTPMRIEADSSQPVRIGVL